MHILQVVLIRRKAPASKKGHCISSLLLHRPLTLVNAVAQFPHVTM